MAEVSLKQVLTELFDREMETTRKILERVPFEKFDWVPHAKSTPLGRLANHVATLPRFVPHILDEDNFMMVRTAPLDVKSTADIIAVFDDLVKKARISLEGTNEERLGGEWIMSFGDKVITKAPRVMVFMQTFLGHIIHHRAQLGVYLRLNDVALPGSYGPSADEPW